jgi:amino acid adenylation domain-containing protein
MNNFASRLAELNSAQKRELLKRPADFNLFALSHGQERMWFLDQLQPGTPNYNMPASVELRGALNVVALEGALADVVQRHESLRTAFLPFEGVPMQSVQPSAHRLRHLDLSALGSAEQAAQCTQLTLTEARQAFDLRAGHLFRTTLLRLSDTHHVLLMTLHHIVSDDWSHGLLMREIAAGYARHGRGGAPLQPLPLQYADYACWEREQLDGDQLQRLEHYWAQRLAGAPGLLALPLDRPRPAVQQFNGARIDFEIDAALAQRLSGLARDSNATLFMVALCAFQILLQRYSGQDDIVVATPIANRPTPELEALIGLFFNTLVLRTDCSGDPSFASLLNRVRETSLDAYTHQALPFVKLVERLQPERALSHNPLAQVMFIMQNAPQEAFDLPGVQTQIRQVDNGTAQFDLIVSLRQQGELLAGYVHYDTDLFDGSTMQRLIGHYKTLLRGVCAAPTQRISMLTMLTQPELRQVRHDWNDTTQKGPRGVCLQDLVAKQVAARPDAVAVVAGRRKMSYAELDVRSNQLAHRLIALGAGPGATVGVCLRSGVDVIVAMLAAVKAGSAYVPLDANYPAERLAFMVRDANVAVLVSDASLLAGLPHTSKPLVCLDESTDWQGPLTPPAVQVNDDHLAYVIYTSGTTGLPKGVMIRHAGIVNNLLDLNEHFRVGPSDSILALSSFSFDMFVYESFGMLAAGGRIVMPAVDHLRDPAHWVDLIRQHGVSIWNSAPALLDMLLRHVESLPGLVLPSLRAAILGGDWVAVDMPARFRRMSAGSTFVVLGGATEASIHSIIQPVTTVDPGWVSIPYGKPMRNQRAYVLDRALQSVPVGVAGELYLGGTGLARGYHARRALTAEKFLPDPFADVAGARMYRTGDLASLRADGTIILIGRIDHQVKIRGHRVELGEIEAVLGEHQAVRHAVVGTRPDATGEKRLMAWLVLVDNAAASVEDVLAQARAKLPAYMVPARTVLIDTLPLSPNGKVNRAALPTPDALPQVMQEVPTSALQRLVASLFAEVLGLDSVGLRADFFDLGGHSLRATRLTAQVRELLHIELPLRSFLLSPNVAAVAAALEDIAANQGVALAPIVEAFENTNDAADLAPVPCIEALT